MRASDEKHVLRACEGVRPGAKLVSRRTPSGTVTLAVWRLETDLLVGPDAKVPTATRWRAQVVSEVEASGAVWWWGHEGQGSSKERAIEDAIAGA